MAKVFDSTIGSLNTALNLREMENNIISANIANADTPEYKAKRIDFESALRSHLGIGNELKMTTTDGSHSVPREDDPINPEIYDDPNGVESLDGNTVDRGEEMARLAENQLLYSASIELLKKKLGMLKYGITEGGGNR